MKSFVAVLTTFAFISSVYTTQIVAHAKEVVELNSTTFEETVASGIWIVNFYAPWCERCKTLSPVFDRVAADNTDADVNFARVHYGKNRAVNNRCKVDKIPAIAYKIAGLDEFGHFHDERSKDGIEGFISRIIAPDFTMIDSVAEVESSDVHYENVSFVLTIPFSSESKDEEHFAKSVTEAFMKTARRRKAHASFLVASKSPDSHLSIAKMEKGRLPIYMTLSRDVNSETGVTTAEDIDYFVTHHNFPLINTFDNHNYKRMAHLDKVMMLLLVNHMNPAENDKLLIDSFEEAISSNYLPQDVSDIVFGHIDVQKWYKFVKQFQAKVPSVLVVDFRTNQYENFLLPTDTNNQSHYVNFYKIAIDAILKDTLQTKPIVPLGIMDKLKYRYNQYFPYSLILCIVPVVLILFSHFLAPHPGDYYSKKKD